MHRTDFTAFPDGLINKPGGINIIPPKQIAASDKTTLIVTDLGEIEKTNRIQYNSGNVPVVYVLFADGAYSTANVVGVA